WDQFAVNERLYGVTSSYNEEEYTTTIDRSTADYKRREAAAAKIAREIENSSALNAHVKEERGDTYGNGSGLDEEEKYSGVARNFPLLSSGQPNKYTPPARRPPTGQPTVSGAPFDPAIISSQLRDPGAPSTKPVQTQSQVSAEAQPSSIAAKQDAQAVPTVSVPSEFSTADASATSNATTSGPTDLPTKASGTDAAVVKPSSPSAAPLVQEKKTKVLNATANVEKDLLNSFREFSNSEKLKVQERQRSHAKHEKTVRMNDLKKFAQNFKLKTEVPQDLIPILAKDKTKQDEIIEKAKRQKQEAEVAAGTASSHATPSPVEQKVQQPPPSGVVETNIVSPSSQIDRQSRSRAQPPQAPRLMHAQNITLPSPRHAMPLSARLTINQQQHKAGLSGHIPPPVPMELHIPPHNPAGPVSTDLLSPTSSASTRFNVKATEFRPNAAAAGFTPSGPSAGISPKLDT
ncbi:poly(A)-binding protein binding protein, partial [Cryomyces antarcticus]